MSEEVTNRWSDNYSGRWQNRAYMIVPVADINAADNEEDGSNALIDNAIQSSKETLRKNNGETGDDVFQQTNPSFAISKSRVQYSNLASLDVWSREVRLRSQNEAKKAGFGPYRPGTLGGSRISKMCCGAQAAEQVLDE